MATLKSCDWISVYSPRNIGFWKLFACCYGRYFSLCFCFTHIALSTNWFWNLNWVLIEIKNKIESVIVHDTVKVSMFLWVCPHKADVQCDLTSTQGAIMCAPMHTCHCSALTEFHGDAVSFSAAASSYTSKHGFLLALLYSSSRTNHFSLRFIFTSLLLLGKDESHFQRVFMAL